MDKIDAKMKENLMKLFNTEDEIEINGERYLETLTTDGYNDVDYDKETGDMLYSIGLRRPDSKMFSGSRMLKFWERGPGVWFFVFVGTYIDERTNRVAERWKEIKIESISFNSNK
ncbi:MAG: hypothetical protein ACYCO0_03545 [Candidatus Micrarchaeaceae archaeon]